MVFISIILVVFITAIAILSILLFNFFRKKKTYKDEIDSIGKKTYNK